MIKVIIENEESLSLAAYKEGKKDWQGDWDKLILPEIDSEKPCFMLYKIELKVPEFIFISFIPDTASTRQKMIYSSTKAALKVR
jgi:twinfilin-like protein